MAAEPSKSPKSPRVSKKVVVASQQKDGGVEKSEGESEASESRLAWLMGWVIGPGAVLGMIFVGGVLVGAHYHEGWIARVVMWTASFF